MIRALLPLALLFAACTPQPGDAADAGAGACVDGSLYPDAFHISRDAAGAPTGPSTIRQQIRVLGCEGLQYYWIDPQSGLFWRELVTNCAPDGTTFPCLVDFSGNGLTTPDPFVQYQRRCVCCFAGRCAGFLCPTLPTADGGTTTPCAPEDTAFQVTGDGGTPIPQPRTRIDICQCASEML